jgi:hypothetical protein
MGAIVIDRDERGAIMVMGLMMAVFLVGMLYYVVGLGEAVLYRELLQDASDTAALSSALIHARGMNFIVLINLIMAALMTVLLVLNVLMTLLRVAIIALTLMSWISGGATGAMAGALAATHQAVQSVYTPTENIVMTLLEVLHGVSEVVRRAVPPVAILDTVIEVSSHQQGPAKLAFAVPTRIDLPVEPDAYSVLCQRAQDNVAEFVMDKMPAGTGFLVGNAAQALTEPSAQWLCGSSSAPRPSYERRQQYPFPTPTEYQSCIYDPEKSLTDRDERERCDALRAQRQQALPDERGDCRPSEDCSVAGPYEAMIALAREQCKPDPNRPLGGYRWQQKKISIELEWTGEGWNELNRNEEPGRILPLNEQGSEFAPCGTDPGALGEDWQERVHPSGDVSEVNPVCVEDHENQLPTTIGLQAGSRHRVSYEAVTQIFGCTQTKAIRVPLGPNTASPTGDSSSEREPYRVINDVQLGTEDFQLRALAVADDLNPAPANVIQLAAWKRCEDEDCAGLAHAAAALSRFSAAQAEYYYDHDGSEAHSEWMWNMKWRARLVRLGPFADDQLDSGVASPQSLCTAMPNAEGCGEAAASLRLLSEVSLH